MRITKFMSLMSFALFGAASIQACASKSPETIFNELATKIYAVVTNTSSESSDESRDRELAELLCAKSLNALLQKIKASYNLDTPLENFNEVEGKDLTNFKSRLSLKLRDRLKLKENTYLKTPRSIYVSLILKYMLCSVISKAIIDIRDIIEPFINNLDIPLDGPNSRWERLNMLFNKCAVANSYLKFTI